MRRWIGTMPPARMVATIDQPRHRLRIHHCDARLGDALAAIPSCAALAVYLPALGVAVKDEHTDGGTWRGTSHPKDSTAPPRLP